MSVSMGRIRRGNLRHGFEPDGPHQAASDGAGAGGAEHFFALFRGQIAFELHIVAEYEFFGLATVGRHSYNCAFERNRSLVGIDFHGHGDAGCQSRFEKLGGAESRIGPAFRGRDIGDAFMDAVGKAGDVTDRVSGCGYHATSLSP